jgi:zinc protease
LQVSIVGDVTQAQANNILDKIFATLPQGPEVSNVEKIQLVQGPKLKVIPFNTPQTLIYFGGPGIAESDPDYLAATVGVSIIQATLVDIIRQERGLSYDVSYDIYQRETGSIALGRLRTSNATAGKSLEAVKYALDLALKYVADENVERSVRYLKGQADLGYETNAELAGILKSLQTAGYASNYLSIRGDLLEKVTGDDVRRAIARMVDPEKMIVVAVGMPEGLEEQ